MKVDSKDGDYLIRNGRLNLTPELSARLGIPNGIEFWRYNLVRGATDPGGYSAAMRSMDNKALHFLMSMFDQLEVIARRNPGILVPVDHDAQLHALLDDLRARVRSEASGRGVTLVPWSSAQVQQ